MTTLRVILSCLLLVMFVWLAGFNASIIWRALVRRKKSPSWVPLVGGVCGSLALVIAPVPGAREWWWLPLNLDWGSVGFIVMLVSMLIWAAVGGKWKEPTG